MKLTRKQRMLGVVLAVGAGLVVFDQLVLLPSGPRAAGASELPPSGGADDHPTRVPLILTSDRAASSGVRASLERVHETLSLGLDDVAGAFVTDADGEPAASGEGSVGRSGPELTGVLSAIRPTSIASGATPIAVIQGRSLRVGDEIDGFVLERIDSDSVIVGREGSSYRLPIVSSAAGG